MVRFPHKSVAEYLTARARAARIPADFPGLKEHLDENNQGAQRNLMVLTVAAWTRLPGHDAALLFRHLLADANLLPLAVDLLTTGVTPGRAVEEAVTTEVLLQCRDARFVDQRQFDMVVRLGPRRVSHRVFAELLMNEQRETSKVALAARNYGVLFDREEAVRVLERLAKSAKPTDLLEVARALEFLGALTAGEEICRRVTGTDNVTAIDLAMAAYLLAAWGCGGSADAAWRALESATYFTNAAELAAKALVMELGRAVAPEICARLLDKGVSTWTWSEIALLFAEEGAAEEAVRLATAVLDTGCDLMDDGYRAIDALVRALQLLDPADLADSVLRHASQQPGYIAAAADELARASQDEAAVRVARVCDVGAVETWELLMAIDVALAATPPRQVADVRRLVLHSGLDAEYRLKLPERKKVAVDLGVVREVCESALTNPSTADDLMTAATVWLDRTAGEDAVAVVELLGKHLMSSGSLVGVLRSLARHGRLAEGLELVESVLRDVRACVGDVAAALRLCADHLPDAELDRLAGLASTRLLGSERVHIAAVLRGVGRPDLGIPLWRKAVVDRSTAMADRIEAADQLVAVGSGDQAVAALKEAERGASATDVRTLRKLVAWIRSGSG